MFYFKKNISKLLSLFFIFNVFFVKAQIESIEVGVNGLTCSQCTRSVELALRKLPFVKKIEMNLQLNKGTILIEEQKELELEKINEAIEDAGFSTFYVKLNLNFEDSILVSSDECYTIGECQYQFVNVQLKTLIGVHKLTIIGESFMSRKKMKKWKKWIKPNCRGKVYFVTI